MPPGTQVRRPSEWTTGGKGKAKWVADGTDSQERRNGKERWKKKGKAAKGKDIYRGYARGKSGGPARYLIAHR